MEKNNNKNFYIKNLISALVFLYIVLNIFASYKIFPVSGYYLITDLVYLCFGYLIYKKSKDDYNFGIKKGIWEIYWHSGQIFRQGNYVNGKKEGLWLDYHENGQLWDIGSYKLGNKNGPWKTYWDHGGLYSKGKLKLGKAEGFWTYFKTDGTLDHVFTGKYSEGKKISN